MADGRSLVAPLPAKVLPGSHFGPDLICFILHQYHHQHVTQPLLLEQLHQWGIDISAGQLSRILTEGKDAFHQEKAELLPTALAVSPYIQVDDTVARHQGHEGFCTHVGNPWFAFFASTQSKSRLNFLEVLHRPHTDYQINEQAVAYWQRQKLPRAVADKLRGNPRKFVDTAAWRRPLTEVGDHPTAACPDRHRGGVAGESDRSWGVPGVGGPQRWRAAVRRLCACGLLAACGTAVSADDPLQ